MNKVLKNKIRNLEWEYIDKYGEVDINKLVGFISPVGDVIIVPDKLHEKFIKKLKCLGVDRMKYQSEYGAIRLRYSDNSQNVEIFKEPTDKQLDWLIQLRCLIYYDFWSNVRSACPSDGVNWYGLITAIRRHIEELKKYREKWIYN